MENSNSQPPKQDTPPVNKETTTSISQQPQPEAQKTANRLPKILIITIAVFLVISFFGSWAYYRFWEYQRGIVKKPEPSLTPSVTPTTKPSKDLSTEEWKVYKSEEYGFEIKYPKKWRLISRQYNPSSDLYYQLFLTNNKQLTLALLNSPNRKAPEDELVYTLAIWEHGNIAGRYQEDVRYKLLGTTNNYDFVSVDDHRNPGKEIFNHIFYTFKFIE